MSLEKTILTKWDDQLGENEIRALMTIHMQSVFIRVALKQVSPDEYFGLSLEFPALSPTDSEKSFSCAFADLLTFLHNSPGVISSNNLVGRLIFSMQKHQDGSLDRQIVSLTDEMFATRGQELYNLHLKDMPSLRPTRSSFYGPGQWFSSNPFNNPNWEPKSCKISPQSSRKPFKV